MPWRSRGRKWAGGGGARSVVIRILLMALVLFAVAYGFNRIAVMTDSHWRSVVMRLLVG